MAVEEVRAWIEGRTDTPHGQALIASRLAQLSAADREVLCLAAIIRERFDLNLLAGTLGGEAVDLARRLEKLRLEQGLLTEDGAGYRFAHKRILQYHQGIPGSLPLGSGGLYALRDQTHYLRLYAHVNAPSEVLFEVH